MAFYAMALLRMEFIGHITNNRLDCIDLDANPCKIHNLMTRVFKHYALSQNFY